MNATDPNLLILVNAGSTLFITGVIWFVQVVHYPLMAGVGTRCFADYERRHTRLTTWVVAPPMLVEAATALILTFRPGEIPSVQAWLGLGLVVVIWISTALFQVPQHRRLESGFDARAHRKLVNTNWIRVIAWTARSILLLTWLT